MAFIHTRCHDACVHPQSLSIYTHMIFANAVCNLVTKIKNMFGLFLTIIFICIFIEQLCLLIQCPEILYLLISQRNFDEIFLQLQVILRSILNLIFKKFHTCFLKICLYRFSFRIQNVARRHMKLKIRYITFEHIGNFLLQYFRTIRK